MVRMKIKSLCCGMGPLPSAVVLQPIVDGEDEEASEVSINLGGQDKSDFDAVTNTLPINLGAADAATICAAAGNKPTNRPLTHELLAATIQALGAKLQSVSINRVEDTTFFASINIETQDGVIHHIDARPSDAITLAIYADVDILAAEEVLESAGSPDYEAIERQERKRQEDEFHNFVENLSPEDFADHGDN